MTMLRRLDPQAQRRMRSRLLTFVVTTVLILDATAYPQPSQQSASTSGLIVGQVIDALTGKPIRGAIVSISGGSVSSSPRSPQPPPVPQPRIFTGADGYFVFRNLPKGSFSVSATKSGYVDGSYGSRRPAGPSQPIALGDGERVGGAVVRMWKEAAITGTVVDEEGEPLVGIQIRALRRTTTGGRRRFVPTFTAKTDDRGVYRLARLIPGEYLVAASARQVALPLAVTQFRHGPRAIADAGDLALQGSAGSIRVGDLEYMLGSGVPTPPPLADEHWFVYPPTFHPSAATAAQALTILVGAGEERRAVNLELHPVPTVRVSGIVIGPDGPADGILVQLIPNGAADVGLNQDAPTTATDGNGTFTFPSVPTGLYSLRAAMASPREAGTGAPIERPLWSNVPVGVGQNDIDDFVIVLQAGIRISGRLEFEGIGPKPPTGLQQVPLVIEPDDSTPVIPIPTPPARVESNGQFTTAPLAGGRYFVRVAGSPVGWMFKAAMYDGRDVSETPLELEAGDVSGLTITFTARWTGLRGVVRSARGDADATALVIVFPADAQRWSNFGVSPRRLRSTRTNKYGEYQLTSLPPGDYLVVAVPDEVAADWQDVTFLEAVARIGVRVSIGEGEQRAQNLRTQIMR